MRVKRLEVGVDVHLVIHRVTQPMQADAGVLVFALCRHGQPVGARAEAAKPEHIAVEPVLGCAEALAVQVALLDRARGDVDEGFRPLVRGVEDDRRRALERLGLRIIAEHQ